VALLVISGSVLVIQGLTKLVHTDYVRAQASTDSDWQIFCKQMRSELAGSEFERVEGGFLYVKKAGTELRFGKVADDFRKTNAAGAGYQPMIFGLEAANISEKADSVQIDLKFQKGEVRTFLYKFTKSKAGSSSTP